MPLILGLAYLSLAKNGLIAAPKYGEEPYTAYLNGALQQSPLAVGLIGSIVVMHVMGLRDDRKALGPYIKLFIQLGVTAALVIPFKPLWSLTALDDRLTIACGEGAVRLIEVQRAGKQPMKAEDFLRGTAVAKGTVVR